MLLQNQRSSGEIRSVVAALLGLVLLAGVIQGCAVLAGAAAGGAVGYVAGKEGAEDEIEDEDPFE